MGSLRMALVRIVPCVRVDSVIAANLVVLARHQLG
jgi:hypothetical protein